MSAEPQLGYTRGVLAALRQQHEHLSHAELLDLVCALTKEYVLDKTIPFDFPLPERAEELRADPPDVPAQTPAGEVDSGEPAPVVFARLVDGLKRRTGLPQFDGFSLENGQAVLVVDNQKVVFGERVTVRMVSGRRRASLPDVSPIGVPAAAAAAAAAPSPEPVRRESPPPPLPLSSTPPVQDDDDEDDDDAGVERFRGLDLS